MVQYGAKDTRNVRRFYHYKKKHETSATFGKEQAVQYECQKTDVNEMSMEI